MNIVIVPDSFKECLSAKAVAANISIGILQVFPKATLVEIPISDGGEGMLESIAHGIEVKLVTVEVMDPLMRNIEAQYGILKDKKTAVIEMAKASGLELLKEEEKNPMITSTYGTGQLIKDALDKGCTKIIIGIGGTATNDGGAGMVKALGARLLDSKEKLLKEGGGYLNELHTIDMSNFDERILQCELVVACDVRNPLIGENGASIVYGRQKGGKTKDLEQLDANLTHYAKCIDATIGIAVANIPGAGAAGGTGAALLAFLKGKLSTGIELMMETLQLEEHIKIADLVITAEGKIDGQTLHGKTIAGVAKLAQKQHVPVIVITGNIDDNIEEIYTKGVCAVHAIVNKPMNLSEAIAQAPNLIQQCAKNIMGTIAPFARN